ncbi:MAG TPA: hypothetical protein DCL54_16200 [Alphaproteobacteria bacterium]|nr:hypothetical protein [Alphaproteobacteria bacterium]HAJ48115.1 hypothetical protein [Alphaproteobacteria bacterium]
MAFFKDDPALQTAKLAPTKPVPQPGGGIGAGVAKTYNRIGNLIAKAGSAAGGIETAVTLAIWYVESGGHEFTPGRAILRFENHKFFEQWGRANAKLYDQHFQHGGRAGVEGKPWENHAWRDDPSAEFERFHGSQQKEYWVLVFAVALAAQEKAYRAASIGGPQIMMTEFAALGYLNAIDMYRAFQEDERWHVLGFLDFCAAKPAPQPGGLLTHMKNKDWEQVARYYNGPGQVDAYAKKFAQAYAAAVNLGLRK